MSKAAPTNHLGQIILDNLLENPENVLQLDARTGETETRISVRERGIRVARHMTKLGLRHGDVITLCLFNSNDTCLPVIAGFLLGVAISPLDVRMSKMEFEYLLGIYKPKMVFCDVSIVDTFAEVLKKLGNDAKIVVYGESKNPDYLNIKDFYAEVNKKKFQVVPLDPDTTDAYILCSSGSTGLPKGVCHTHSQSIRTVRGIKVFFNNLKMLQFSSLYWLSGFAMTLMNLTVTTVRINAPPFETDLFYEYSEKYKPEMVITTPSVARLIINHEKFNDTDLSHMKLYMLSGATVDFAELAILQKHLTKGMVINSYGLTEIGGPVTYTTKEQGLKNGTCGKIIPHIQYKLVDISDGRIIDSPNEAGELYLKSASMMSGYYGNPQATAEALDSEGWFKTGDLVKLDEEGYVYIVDRLKEIFKYMGYCIAPAGIEHVINSHEGVTDSAVIGIDNKDSGHVPLAFIKRKEGSNVTAQEIKDLVEDKLAFYCELRGGVVFLDDIELTPSGKIIKKGLRDLAKTIVPE
ncbi:luciferin 4-monooxygenase-like [Arctopsyche grandis]|uniref:luciferin 4-monooxygenase-like n=1 Tax=Arctopsyche grandis TaxID=121162 RepID=UPI00406D9E76